jgi:hypothetical protein
MAIGRAVGALHQAMRMIVAGWAGIMEDRHDEAYLSTGDAARLLGGTPAAVTRATARQRSTRTLVPTASHAADLRRVARVAAAVANGSDLSRILDRIVRAATNSLGGLQSTNWNSLSTQIAILDEHGTVVAINASWKALIGSGEAGRAGRRAGCL